MENKILANVCGKQISEKDLEMAISRFPRERQGMFTTEQGKKQLLDQLVSFELFYNYAVDSGLEKSKEYVERVDILKREVLTEFAIQTVLQEIEVTDKEIEEYYEANKDKFKTPETVNAKHILVETEEKAKEIAEKIKNGMAFEDAAKEFSTCPSKQNGGSLGSFGRGQMVPEFEKAAFELELGIVSEPVKTQFGYHLIKVEDKNEGSIKSFDEVKEMIKGGVMQEKQNHKYMSFTEELKQKYDVKINE